MYLTESQLLQRILTLTSPLDGLWDKLETYEPPSDDLLRRLRDGFELEH